MQVELDLDQIHRLAKEYDDSLRYANSDVVPRDTVVVLGSVLHSFYNGAENALKRIILATDKKVLGGESSHAAILKLASTETNARPPIISQELHFKLLPFMAFRHFFRHAYSFQMDWQKMKALVQEFHSTSLDFSAELYKFLETLDKAD